MKRKGACVAFASFEFVHRGHCKIIERTIELAKEQGLEAVVLSCPCEGEVYTTEKEKEYLMKELGVQKFISYEGRKKVDELLLYLKEELGAQVLVLEEEQEGLLELKQKAEKLGMQVDVISGICYQDRRISSEWVKEAFEANNFELVTELCGHPFIMIGDVVHGKKLGRTVGMPTTNLHIYKTKKRPNSGVYATKLVLDGQKHLAATNIGTRPTVDDFDYITIESFILDFNKQIYGEICVLEVHKYLRGIQKFEGLEQVQAQVKKDVEEIKQFFA